MQIHNTNSRKIEKFKPLKEREVKIYCCGPTAYNHAHIWNLRTYVFEDIVIKTLKFLWYNTKTTMNITDVDDKTVRNSIKAKQNLKDFTQKYTKIFLEDIKKINIQKADNIVLVTDLIPEMVKMINTLLRRWFAYLSEDNSIYYKISKFKKYWVLANLDIKKLKSNIRINNDEYEKDSLWDFVLWKSWKKEEKDNFWEEEFETYDSKKNQKKVVLKWRPWWHIECSACNMKIFWPQIDVHMWWEDNIFPHHQNEIAQTEACTKKEFSKYWLHCAHLMVDGKKMSKSLWNFYTIEDLEKKYSNINNSILYRAIRLAFINWKFRDSINFSFDKLEANFNTISNIDSALKNINNYNSEKKWVSPEFRDLMQKFIKDYIACLENNFDIVNASVVMHEFIKFVNIGISNNTFTFDEKISIIDMFKTFNEVLWIFDFSILKHTKISKKIEELFKKRNKAKKEKDFDLADRLRDEIKNLWYKIIDTKNESRLEKI